MDIANLVGPTGTPKVGVTKLDWLLLHLEVAAGNSLVDPVNLPVPAGKSALDLVSDYLSRLRGAIHLCLQKSLGDTFGANLANIQYLFSTRRVHTGRARDMLCEAIAMAGFVPDANDARLQLLSAEEAMAHYCAKSGIFNTKQHDAFLIVDCGSGTVTLTGVEVKNEFPLDFSFCTAESGDSCGWVL